MTANRHIKNENKKHIKSGVLNLDGFNEQVVKRVNKPKNLIIKIISILLLLLVPTICISLAYVITPYLIYIGFFAFLIGIYVVWYVFTSQKVEFEYSVLGSELTVSKIIALRKRKVLCKVKINEIEKLGKGEKTINGMRFSKTYIAAADIDKEAENYYATFNSPAYGKCLLIFNPDENTLQGMKKHLSHDLLIKLFYRKDA